FSGDFSGTSVNGAPATGDLDATDEDDDAGFTVTTDGANGTATIDTVTGEWSYTPDAGYEGPDSFTVTVTDELGGTTTQEITVTLPALPPVHTAELFSGDFSGTSVNGAPATGDLDAT